MQDEAQRARELLIRLMTKEATLTEMTDEQLISGARSARTARKYAEGRAAAELHSRGWTWEKIGAELGVNQSTAHRWAAAYAAGITDQPAGGASP